MPIRPRPFRRLGRVTLVAGAALLAATLLVWYLIVTDPSPYGRVLNELRFPGVWAQSGADVEHRELLYGPTMDRFHMFDADPDEIAPVVARVVTDAGFTLDTSVGPSCYRDPSDGPIEACTVAATRDKTRLWIVMFARGKRVPYSYGGEPTVGAPNLSVVRVQAGSHY
jgi:hypothetical protein